MCDSDALMLTGMLTDRSSPVRAARASSFYGWKLLAVFWLILLANLGFPMYGGAFLNSMMATHLGFSRQMLGLPFSVFLGTVGLSSPLVAALIKRFGVRSTLVLGNGCVACGALIMGTLVTSGVVATIVFGIVVGFGVAAGGNLTAQTAIPRWFVRRRSLAFAIMLTASATGGFVAPPLMNAVIGPSGDSWWLGWIVLAAIAVGAALLAALYVREAPEDLGQFPDGATTALGSDAGTRTAGQSISLEEAVRAAPFWVISLASACATGAFGLILAHGVANARDAGYSAVDAALVLSFVSLSGFAGKAIAGGGGDRWNPALIWSGLMFTMAVGLAIATAGTNFGGPYASAIAMGAGFGGIVVCQPATIARFFGTNHFARLASTVYFLQAIAGILLPWAAGWAFDRFHTYGPGFLGSALACLASGILLVVFCRDAPRSGQHGQIDPP